MGEGGSLLGRQRQTYILERIRIDGGVRVADLVRHFNVSDMTVRRDLELLAERGLVEKVHGGATAVPGGPVVEPGFAAKSSLQQAEKDAIARAAAGLVRPRTAIAISAGTTTFALAQELLDIAGLTVVTNSPPVADLFHYSGRSDQTVILTGGVRTPSDGLVGPMAVSALRSVHVDLVLMGVHGMDPHTGFTTPNLLEAETDRALIETGRRLVVVADHTKWGVIGISSIGRLDEADVLITDAGLPVEARAALRGLVGQLIVVDPATGEIAVDPASEPSGDAAVAAR